MNAINKSSPDAVEGYKDFSCTDQAVLTEGNTYTISVQTNPSLTQDTKVWIDFNNDGTFNQANELVFTSLNSINPSGNISIPLGAAIYNTLLRLRVSSENSGVNQGPCSSLIKGQVEDYGVKIQQFVGTAEVQGSTFNVQVYPNPFSESAVLAVNFPLVKGGGGDLVFTLYDLCGRIVKEQTIIENQTTIERRTLKAGIYFYKLMGTNQTVATGKMVVQ